MPWEDIAKWLWGALIPVGIWIFKRQEKRMDDLETAMEEKADKSEMGRQRDNTATLFEKLEEHARRDEEMHNTVISKIHEMHVDLLEKIGRK